MSMLRNKEIARVNVDDGESAADKIRVCARIKLKAILINLNYM